MPVLVGLEIALQRTAGFFNVGGGLVKGQGETSHFLHNLLG